MHLDLVCSQFYCRTSMNFKLGICHFFELLVLKI